MTVVRPNSIAGINSITVQTGQALNIHDASGNLIRSLTNSSGVSTFSSINVTQGSGDLTVGVSTFFVDNSATNVGVGTNVPYNNAGTNVHIHSANTTSEIRFTNSSTGGGNNGGTIQQGGTTLYVSNSEAGNIVFENNGSERLRILSTGRIGINTSEATSSLQIYAADLGEGTAKGQIVLKDTAAYNASPQAGIVFQGHHASNNAQAIFAGIRGLKANAADGDYDGCLAFDVRTHGAVAYEAMRINEAGQLGIGTASPSVALDIVRSKVASSDRNTDDAITVENNGTTNINLISANNNSGFLLFSDDVRARGYVKYNHVNDTMSFKTDGDEHLLIGSGGDLTLTGDEGTSANLYLLADQGDDSGDGWRVGSNQDVNDLTLANNTSGSYVDKMRLSKEGYPTFPSLPAFSAKSSSSSDYTSGATVLYPNEHFDRNGDYNTSNSYFTAPIAGIYFVSWSHKASCDNGCTVYSQIQKSTNDGSSWSQIGPALEFSSDISSEHTGMSCIVSIEKDALIRIASATNVRVDGSDHFAMCLIG